jgi:starch-binding outer membrane protein, SusD/RagB family
MKRYISLFLVTTALAFTACDKDRLDPVPQTYILEDLAFNTAERTLAAVNGLYAGLKGAQYNGATNQFMAGRYLVWQDVRGEDFINETANGVTGLQTWNFTVLSSTNEIDYTWGTAYQAINRANVVLKGIDQAPVSDAQKQEYRAEARFLRALVYHSLVTLYARPYWDGNGSKPGVVIYTEAQNTAGGENNRPRSTVAEVYNLILEDLNFAEQNLPASYSNTQLNVSRAHKNAAIALKTRVYLHMQRYQDVVTEANKLVSDAAPFKAPGGVRHELATDVTTVFGAGGQTLENIFSLAFTPQNLPGTQNSLSQYYTPGPPGGTGNGDYTLNITGSGIAANTSAWPATDRRRTAFVSVINNKTWMRKWMNNTDYVPIIRYSEVLLNLAEALARTSGMSSKAVSLLNAVRQRSDPGVTLAPGSAQALIDAILLERRIELLGEGFRSRDLLRLGMPMPAKGSAPAIQPTDVQYIWPLPVSELLANKSAVQNPGY